MSFSGIDFFLFVITVRKQNLWKYFPRGFHFDRLRHGPQACWILNLFEPYEWIDIFKKSYYIRICNCKFIIEIIENMYKHKNKIFSKKKKFTKFDWENKGNFKSKKSLCTGVLFERHGWWRDGSTSVPALPMRWGKSLIV